MKAKDILWVVVPIFILIALAFALPLLTPESELPAWQGTYQYIFMFVSDTVTFLRSLFNSVLNYSFIPLYIQVVLAFLLKCDHLKKYIIVMLSGIGAFVACVLLHAFLFGILFSFNAVRLFTAPLMCIPLVLTALLLSLLSQSRHRKRILLISGAVLTVLPLILFIHRLIVSLSGSVAVIGGSDGLLSLIMLFDLYAPHIRIIILGILLIILSLVLKKIDEKSSEKQESVIE